MKQRNWAQLAIGATVAVIALWIGSWWTIGLVFEKSQERANFGDAFGAVNALFSGLAFAGVILAVTMQREELELQRAELKLNREELARSASAQQESVKEMEIQARLSALAALISVEREIFAATLPNTIGRQSAMERLKYFQRKINETIEADKTVARHPTPPRADGAV